MIDTPPEVEQVLLAGFRRMSPAEKLARVVSLNRALGRLASARLRAEYGPDLPERDLRLRLAALRLPREVMVEAFGWDPEAHGL